MTTKPLTRGAYVRHYLEAALWASTDGDDPLDDNHGLDDVVHQSIQAARADLAAFLFKARRLIRQTRLSAKQVAHDFFLTRCHHGAGFWDRGLGDAGQALTKLAHDAGEVWPYVGDDGLVYGLGSGA